jgi:hypothetical protein
MPGLTETYVQGDLSFLKRRALEDWHGVGVGVGVGGVGGVDGLELSRRFGWIVNSL